MSFERFRSGPRISVDNDRCELYAICQAEAPELFELGPDGRLRYRRRLAERDYQAAAAAARCCPTQAISPRGLPGDRGIELTGKPEDSAPRRAEPPRQR
ncbi:ferredoxin [Amycolatopsis cihanbeyliensis]|uniref:Ferredoxin n=1 Tax=Amycolatopsis cihanbeyliensis TaxID=1128664 RepID=A0A542DQY2_AMYCI|nr:ferredoxin [Amycolatopsis cihanbeyliensis]TQJ05513.1 ferredoxin [Amycolatopsis cihanbeyliensis]